METPNPTNQELAAYHEAGHAVVALSFGWAVGSIKIVQGDSRKTGEIQLVCGDVPADVDPIGSIAFLAAGNCAELVASRKADSSIAGDWWMFGEPDRREACVIAECKLGCLRKLDVVRTLKEIATNTIRFLIRRDARRLLDEMARMLVATNRLSREEIQSTWAVAPIADSDVQEFRLSLVQAKPQS